MARSNRSKSRCRHAAGLLSLAIAVVAPGASGRGADNETVEQATIRIVEPYPAPEAAIRIDDPDAASVSALADADIEAPPRTIDDLKPFLIRPKNRKRECGDAAHTLEVMRTATTAGHALGDTFHNEQYRVGQAKIAESEVQFTVGNYRIALELLEEAASDNDWSYMLAKLLEARVRGRIGDVGGARNALSSARFRLSRSRWAGEREEWQALYGNTAAAYVEQARGDLAEAVHLYREVLAHPTARFTTMMTGDHNMPVQFDHVRLDFSLLLLRLGRLVEAEFEARIALKNLYTRNDFNFQGYGANTAAAVAVLADVLHEQGRLEEAERLARVAVDMHEYDCTPQSSLYFATARRAYARGLAAAGRWDEVLAQFDAVEQGLSDDPEVLARLFENSTDWALALVAAGRASEAVTRLEAAARREASRYGADSYEAAELQGFTGIARFAAADREGAIADFEDAVPRLIEARRDPAGLGDQPSRDARLTRIIEAWMRLLLEESEAGRIDAAQAIESTFRLANAARGRAVQRAVTAASARSTVEDPALAALIHRAQNTTRRIAVLLQTVANLHAAPSGQVHIGLIEAVQARIERLRAQQRAFADHIASAFPEYDALVNPKASTIDDARRALQPGEVLVATYTTPTRTYVWSVPKSGPIGFSSSPLGRAALRESVRTLRSAFDAEVETIGDIAPFDVTLAHRLYQTLLAPHEERLRGVRTLVVAPHDALGTLPLALLATSDSSAIDIGLLFTRYRAVEWLAKRHAIVQIPTVSTLLALRRATARPRAPAASNFAGFGDPLFDSGTPKPGAAEPMLATSYDELLLRRRTVVRTRDVRSADLGDLPPLPDTAEELEAIAGSLGASPQTDVFLGARAREETVKSGVLEGRKVVAFATHGLVPGDLNGLHEPALALSTPTAGSTEDGLLKMSEVLSLSLDADWVVLSACNSGAAEGRGAEAISGLGRAFFYAGARSLLVSHWPVETTSATAITTGVFAAQAKSLALTRAEALQRSMLALLENGVYLDETRRALFAYAHPIFWAPFTLVGDGGR